MLRKDRKQNHIKSSVKNHKRQKKIEEKNSNKELGQAITDMVGIDPTLLVITLNVTGLSVSIKDVRVDQKNKTQLYVDCRRPTLNIKTHTD